MKAEFGSTAYMLERMEAEPYETVFIVGTGIIKNGWLVFSEAVQAALKTDAACDAPIHAIASLTFTLRLLANGQRTHEEGYKQRLELLRSIKEKIGNEFLRNKKISLLIDSKTDFVRKLSVGRPLIITTNWDTLLEDFYTTQRLSEVLYLHGNVREATGIYLPTEEAIEPYREPTDAEAASHSVEVHRVSIEALEHAKRIVIWASSLDVYDAELCVLIREAHLAAAGRNREYIVINPSKEPLKRLRSIIGEATIRHINPFTFSQKVSRFRSALVSIVRDF